MPRLAAALVHAPCMDKHGNVYTTSITNLDVHDIARSAVTYGLDAFYIDTPIAAQQLMAREIIGFWEDGAGRTRNPDRGTALRIASVVTTLGDALRAETAFLGQRPLLVVTSAKEQGSTTCAALRTRLQSESALIAFGTGHGLAPAVVDGADVVLEPLRGAPQTPGYNHLSVRSAAAIFFDRLRST